MTVSITLIKFVLNSKKRNVIERSLPIFSRQRLVSISCRKQCILKIERFDYNYGRRRKCVRFLIFSPCLHMFKGHCRTRTISVRKRRRISSISNRVFLVFRSLIPSYIRDSNVAIVVYDITSTTKSICFHFETLNLSF